MITEDGNTIMVKGEVWDSMEHFVLAEAEYNEACGKRVTCYPKGEQGYLRADKVNRVSACSLVDVDDGETCGPHSNAGYNSTARGVKLVAFAPHTCDKQVEVQAKHPSSAYSTRQLSSLITPLILNNETFSPKNLKVVLFPDFLKLEPPMSLCKSTLKEARFKSTGDAEEMIKRLPALGVRVCCVCALFITISLDDGGHIVLWAASFFIDNERKDTWVIYLDFLKVVYPGFETEKRRSISDLHPGLVNAIKENLDQGSWFACSQHHGPHVLRVGGKAGVSQYYTAVNAPTRKAGVSQYYTAVKAPTAAKVAEAKLLMSVATKNYLATHPDENLYMAIAGNMRGKSSQSSVEPFNHSNAKARCKNLYGALEELVKDDQRRFYWRKNKALSARFTLDQATGLYASMQKRLEKTIEKAHSFSVISFPDEGDRTRAVVRSATDPNKEYLTNMTLKTCECGMPDIEIRPCKYLISHAQSVGKPLSQLLSSKDSLQYYESQYPDGLEFERPSEATVLTHFANLIDNKVRLPLVVRRKSGRPANKRKKSALERSTSKRAKSTCSICHKEGHTKRKCPNMPASNAP